MPKSDLLDRVMDDLVALEETVDDLEDRVGQINDLRDRVQRLEERTDMLRLVEETEQQDYQQRRAALWQHCVREARQTATEQTVLDREDVERVLHHPDVDRTTLINDMVKVADAVDRVDVATYRGRDAGPTDAAELHVDLREVDDAVDASTLYQGGD